VWESAGGAEYTRKKIRCPSCGVMCEVRCRASRRGRTSRPSRSHGAKGGAARLRRATSGAAERPSAPTAVAAGPPPAAPTPQQPITDVTAAPPRPNTPPQPQCPQCHELLAPASKPAPCAAMSCRRRHRKPRRTEDPLRTPLPPLGDRLAARHARSPAHLGASGRAGPRRPRRLS